MNKSKKLIALGLSAVMVLGSLAACGNDDSGKEGSNKTEQGSDNKQDSNKTESSSDNPNYSATDDKTVYDENLGDYYKMLQKAYEAETVSERYALMAMAEAKLLESATFLPTTTQGGRYAMSKTVPYTIPNVMWGNDFERYHNMLVTTELIKSEDRDAMKAKYTELKGTGEYLEWVKGYLKDKGYSLKDTYNMYYVGDPTTWDVLATSQSADSEAIVNTYDGLIEYDNEGKIQPALAESWEISEDGLKYTFKLRKGLKWVDSQGRAVADLTAQDFVTGFQHMMDAAGGLEYLVDGVIENVSEYLGGTVTDMSEVGVKAVDELTVEYTLVEPKSYFITMFGYGIFAPMSKTYYESQGGKFGAEFDDAAADYTYGKTSNNIAYCGPYLVTSATDKNTIKFEANPSYWNKDNIAIKTLTWLYNDSSDATKAYNDIMAGVVDGASLTTSAVEVAKKDGNFDKYQYVSATNATTYAFFLNLNRKAFANFNDETKMASEKSDEEKERTNKALRNIHFRRAIFFSLDRGANNAQIVGEDIKLFDMRNTYTPGTFVSMEEDVTVDINGTATEFKKGTYYGEIIQAQLTADGSTIKAWDPKAENGMGSTDGFDGWYNKEEAVKELEKAIEQLEKAGVTISKEKPIQIDFPYYSGSDVYVNKANVVKKSIEEALDGKVQINLLGGSLDDWYYSGYYGQTGAENNYDISDASGWGPDYGDPDTYLNTLLPEGAGYVTKSLGIY